MPTYDYKCTKCGEPHQARLSMSDPKPACPACGGELKQVIITAPAVSGANGGGGASTEMPASPCATGTCPFQS
jgi:putative FmdB family regulatory protein